jgi:3-oxoacyl-[acyl-carrier protein] reductase
MPASLAGKVAIVTGASKGIGAAIARELGEHGASVVVNYASDEAGADRVVKAITAGGGSAVAVRANIGDPSAVAQLFSAADRAFGGALDILVNNAGAFVFAPLEQVTPESYRALFDVNVLGTILCSQAAAARFPERGAVSPTSGASWASMGFPGSVVYSATKGAIDSITRVLATELGPKGVRVNAIDPGLIITEGAEAGGMTNNDWEKMWVDRSALGRTGKPSDIAPIVRFLVSSDSRWLTGETLFATGGVR